jgi:hypothetical protein
VEESQTESAFDPIRLPLLISRLVIAFALALLVGSLAVAWALFGFSTDHMIENRFMLMVFSVVSGLIYLVSLVAYLVLVRFVRQPIFMAIIASGCSVFAAGGLIISLPSSIVVQSAIPMAAACAAMSVLAVLAWPRSSAWARWMSRPVRTRPAASREVPPA